MSLAKEERVRDGETDEEGFYFQHTNKPDSRPAAR